MQSTKAILSSIFALVSRSNTTTITTPPAVTRLTPSTVIVLPRDERYEADAAIINRQGTKISTSEELLRLEDTSIVYTSWSPKKANRHFLTKLKDNQIVGNWLIAKKFKHSTGTIKPYLSDGTYLWLCYSAYDTLSPSCCLLINSNTGEQVGEIVLPSQKIIGVSTLIQEKYIIICLSSLDRREQNSPPHSIQIWEKENKSTFRFKKIKTLDHNHSSYRSAVITSNGNHYITSSGNRIIEIFDITNKNDAPKYLHRFKTNSKCYCHILLTADDKFLFIGNEKGEIERWDISNPSQPPIPQARLKIPQFDSINTLQLSSDHQFIFVLGYNRDEDCKFGKVFCAIPINNLTAPVTTLKLPRVEYFSEMKNGIICTSDGMTFTAPNYMEHIKLLKDFLITTLPQHLSNIRELTNPILEYLALSPVTFWQKTPKISIDSTTHSSNKPTIPTVR